MNRDAAEIIRYMAQAVIDAPQDRESLGTFRYLSSCLHRLWAGQPGMEEEADVIYDLMISLDLARDAARNACATKSDQFALVRSQILPIAATAERALRLADPRKPDKSPSD